MTSSRDNRPVRLWLGIAGLAAACIAGLYWGSLVPLSAQTALAGSLQTTSAIIFGVMGAWIAIVYPEAMRGILRKHSGGASSESDVVHKLLAPMILSTIVLGAIVVAQPVGAPIAASASTEHAKQLLQRVSFSGLCVLSLVQFYALILTLYPLGAASRDIQQAENSGQTKHRMGAVLDEPENGSRHPNG